MISALIDLRGQLDAWIRTRLWAQVLAGLVLGILVGYLLVQAREREENPFMKSRRWLQIDQIAVAVGNQRRGYGRALVLEAVAQASKLGITELQTGIWAFNAAVTGSVPEGRVPGRDVRLHRWLDNG